MEFSLKSKDNVYPCEVTIDEDNGRFMIRNTDSTGEVFNSPEELVVWIIENWESSDFESEQDFDIMMKEIEVYLQINH
ncbi:hypothetical protein [Peribacillus alkalitolerans]|uniref:hypothetical protein n=1 Tax=Peribacillus alkalitolerans TaxID=1550385 RepID=UPI0013D53AE8|nr:hypothetical protein [Peribacillus alkalitolerans]